MTDRKSDGQRAHLNQSVCEEPYLAGLAVSSLKLVLAQAQAQDGRATIGRDKEQEKLRHADCLWAPAGPDQSRLKECPFAHDDDGRLQHLHFALFTSLFSLRI